MVLNAEGHIAMYYSVAALGWPSTSRLAQLAREALERVPATNTTAAPPPLLAALHKQGARIIGNYSGLVRRIHSLHGYPIVVNVWGRGASHAAPSSTSSPQPPHATSTTSPSSVLTQMTRPATRKRSYDNIQSAIRATASLRHSSHHWPRSNRCPRPSSSAGRERWPTSIPGSTDPRAPSTRTSRPTPRPEHENSWEPQRRGRWVTRCGVSPSRFRGVVALTLVCDKAIVARALRRLCEPARSTTVAVVPPVAGVE